MSEFANTDGEQDAPFNFSLFYYQSLNKLLDAKDDAYLKNDLSGWYKYSYTLFKRICFKLSEEEERDIADDFQYVANKFSEGGDKKDAIRKLHEIDMITIRTMDKYKMIFPRVNNNIGLKKIATRYNLTEASQ